jgi:hypothetical protein
MRGFSRRLSDLPATGVGVRPTRVGADSTGTASRLVGGCSTSHATRRRAPAMPNDRPVGRDGRHPASVHSGRDRGPPATLLRTGSRNYSSRRGFNSVMMPISFSRLRVLGVHADPTSGGGRAMACRPIGLCPPERLERGWSSNRGARLTRVSAKRLQPAGGAADIRTRRMSRPATTRPRGMGGRERRLTA